MTKSNIVCFIHLETFWSDVVSRIIEYKATLIAMTIQEYLFSQMDFTFLSAAIIAIRAIKSFVFTIKL